MLGRSHLRLGSFGQARAAFRRPDLVFTNTRYSRDQAIARLKGMGDTQQRVEVLIAENSNLKKKLADAEKTVRELSEDKPKKEATQREPPPWQRGRRRHHGGNNNSSCGRHNLYRG